MRVLNICFYVAGSSSLLSHDAEFEAKYQSIYKNIVSFLFDKPGSRLAVSLSGPLLSWIDKRHPEFTRLLSKLIGRRQTEILGGGYYNPVFPLIFSKDRTGQIELMTSEIRAAVGKRPRGMTVFNSIWDNTLVPCFQSCGMEYVFLDSSLIPKERQSYLPLLVTEHGKSICVLPVSRDFIPNMLLSPKEYLGNLFGTVEYLTKDDPFSVLTDERIVTVRIDETQFARLCESRWLDKLFAVVEESFPDSIRITLPLDYLRREQLRVPSYIPAGIQSDVGKWAIKPYEESLGARALRATVVDFLLTSGQNKALYDRMLYISLLINQCKGDKNRRKIAREKLWIAQSGEGYTCDPDGVFANNAVRQHAYRSLTEAEKFIREAQPGEFTETVASYDYNGDGLNEYICTMRQYNACLSPLGAQISELDIMHNTGNYADSPGRIKFFDKFDDRYHRGLFIDHLFSHEEFSGYRKGIPAGDGIFSRSVFRQADFDARRHEIKLCSSVTFPPVQSSLTLVKKFVANSNGFMIQYILKNEGPFDLRGVFVVESNYAQTDFSSVKASSYKVEVVSNDEKTEIDSRESPRSARKISFAQISDTLNDISFIYEPNEMCDIVCMPIFFRRPSSKSDTPVISGNTYMLSLCWSIELAAGKEIEKTINYSIVVPKRRSGKKS